MKIQILKDIKETIDGYNPVFLDDGKISVDYPDNSISSILMIGAIEDVPYELLDNILGNIRKLLRMGGKVVISGVDINCISRDLVNRIIDPKTYNGVVFSKKALYDSKELCDKLSLLGLRIDKITLKGSIYELHASRPN